MGTDQHIYYQNKAVLDFESLALAPWREGSISGQAAVAEIERIAATFETYTAGLGYARALAGARDIRNLAETLKRSISTGAVFPPVVIPAPPGSGGDPIPIGGSHQGPRAPGEVLSSKGWLMIGAAVFFLLMGSRRS